MSSQLIWELVKNNNAFIVKGNGPSGRVFSKEAGNLASLSSYKYSGLANLGNTIDVASDGDALVLSKSSKNKAGKLNSVVIKKNRRRANHAVGAEAASRRPDLKAAAVAKASAVTKSLSSGKSSE